MEINFRKSNLIYPYFVTGGRNKRQPVSNFPGVFRFSIDTLIEDIASIKKLGLERVLLFGVGENKYGSGSSSYSKANIVSRAIREIKKEVPNIVIMTDVCLCAYTTHGHCGVLGSQGEIDNKKTLDALAKMALSHAEAGADWVAPSAMAKNQVRAIRSSLDNRGFGNVRVMGYSAKFASNFYGPFRNAADSAPSFGDRSAYQLNFYESKAALVELQDDIKEGAEVVMVKPALSYLDIIRQAKEKFNHPLAAYNVSGEYTFVKYGAKKGLWDEKKMVFEVLGSIRRAGADFIITYHAKDALRWLRFN